MDLSLCYEDNDTAHDDLFLRFAGQIYVGDSYYFALDRGMQPDDESPGKVKAVVRKLLEQWLTAAAGLADGGTAFLPFDFSDQSTGWLRCQRRGNEMDVSKGYSLVQGHSLFPSVVGEYVYSLPDFYIDGPTVKSDREDLLQAIWNSLAEAGSSGPGAHSLQFPPS
jgi:hypothetical protein